MNGIYPEIKIDRTRTGCVRAVLRKITGIQPILIAIALSTASLSANAQTAATSSQGTDLRAVYEQAKDFDAEYQAAQYELEALLQGIPVARSAFLPTLGLSANANLTEQKSDGQGSYDGTTLSLSLRQSIFNRANSKRLDQAHVNAEQARAQYAAIGQTLILRVATAYFDVLRAQADVEFSQSELQAISRQREQAERRFDVGLVPITDVRSAQAQYDLAVAQEIAASNQLSTAREAMLRISGIDAELLTPLASDLPLTPPEPADIDAWVTLARQQNLELVIAQLARQKSDIGVAVERASRYPTLDLIGSASKTTTGGTRPNPAFNAQALPGAADVPERISISDTTSGRLELRLEVPLYTGGQIKAQVARAKAEALASEQQAITQERTTTQQTRDAYRGVQASISRVRALRQALVSTEKSAEATEAGFRAGTRTSVEVLQALRDTYRAQSDYSGARYDYIINTLNLKAASGTLAEEDIYAINRFLAVPEK